MKKAFLLLISLLCVFCLCSCFEEESNKDDEDHPLNNSDGKYTVEFEVDCLPNLLFSKYDVDIYIDGYELYKLDHGANEIYTVYLSEGNHTITFTKHYSTSVDGSVRFKVTKNMNLKFTIACERNNIMTEMEDKTPFTPDPSFDTQPPKQNDSLSGEVEVTFSCTENLFFSRYDIDIYIDDHELLRLKHGSEKTVKLTLEKGNHVFKFTKAGYASPNGNVQINVTGDMKIIIGLYCTMDYVDVDPSVPVPDTTQERRETTAGATETQLPPTEPAM